MKSFTPRDVAVSRNSRHYYFKRISALFDADAALLPPMICMYHRGHDFGPRHIYYRRLVATRASLLQATLVYHHLRCHIDAEEEVIWPRRLGGSTLARRRCAAEDAKRTSSRRHRYMPLLMPYLGRHAQPLPA